MNPRSLLITLSILLLPFLSVVSAAVPGNWASGDYAVGSLVIYDGTTYIATQAVNSSQGDPKTTTAYWSSLDALAGGMSTPTGQPGSTPDTSGLTDLSVPSDTNGTSSVSISRFLGISTRGPVTASKTMFVGLTVKGTASKKVAIMGKGKTMTQTDANIDYLRDPSLLILKLGAAGWEALAQVDDLDSVSGDQHINSVQGKEGITMPIDSKEAAVVLTLEPGNYAAILSGNDSDFGSNVREAIIEAYEIED